jgi:hypothetical protein
MKILGFTIKKKAWKSLSFVMPLVVLLFSYQQCSRECAVEANREVGSVSGVLPFCTVDSTVDCVNEFKSCGDHLDKTTWYEDGDDTDTKERVCTYGDKVNDTYIVQDEYICHDGVTSLTGNKKDGALKTAGQCSSVPFNCGAHLDSTTWWELDKDNYTKTPRVCADNSTPAYNYYNTEKEYKCTNGVVAATNQTRLTTLAKVDNCPSENNCGIHTEGSIWYEGVGNVQSKRKCSDAAGTEVIDTYSAMKEMKCVSGAAVDQNAILKGDLISYGACPGAVNCGDHNDGATWKEVTTDEIKESFTCADKLTSAESRYQKVQVKLCTAGVVTVKETIKGDLLSIGVCPKAGCTPYLDGESWLADLGLLLTENKNCPYGPANATIIYANLQEQKCNNGSKDLTGYTQKGDQKSEVKCHVCAPDTKQDCIVGGGKGSQTCKTDGSGYGACTLQYCNSGYYINNNTCTPQVCTPKSTATCVFDDKSTGKKVCNDTGSAYGSCEFVACNAGYVNVKTPKLTINCLPLICTPNSVDTKGCTNTPVAGGTFSRQCDATGTAYNSCVLSCTDGSAPKDGKCAVYSWGQLSDQWSACSADCGGTQSQQYVCKSNFGEVVDDSKCTTPKPVTTRVCDAKTGSWNDGMEIISPSTREVCPGLYLGYIEKVYQKPVSYSCVNHVKTKALGEQTLLATNNYCSAIQPARCSHDSLSVTESLNRLNWMKACQDQVPVIKTFFDIIGGADQLSMYLNDTSSKLYGTARPRPLYVTFSDKNNTPWIAPKTFDAKKYNCTTPSDVKIFGICTSSCYTPDQKLLFSVSGKQQYIPIIDAIAQAQPTIVTLGQESMLEKLVFSTAPIAHFVSELVDTNHKILVFNTQTGGRLSVTYNHPLVASDGVIREASDFKVGDQLIRADGSFDEITNIEDTIYPGKVHNVLPYGESTMGNIVVAEGFLSGSAYFQNDGVNYMNQKILRSNLLQGVDLGK